MSYSAANMSGEARAYYDGGKRVMVGGIPKRAPAWVTAKAPAKDSIVRLVSSGSLVERGDLPDAPGFRFTPVESVALYHGKPSARGNYAYSARGKFKNWKPAGISLAPNYTVPMLGDSWELHSARGKWARDGNPEPLREYLAETADERRATWAAIDACNAVASFAKAFGRAMNWEERKAESRYIALCDSFAAHGFEKPARMPQRLAA
jgi:hypothetical protein